MSRFDIGRKSCTCAVARKIDRLAHGERGLDVGEHQRGGAVGHQRAVGALERTRHERVLLALGAAELEAEILAHLRIGIGDAVLVVLGRDHAPARRTGRRISGNRASAILPNTPAKPPAMSPSSRT